MDNYDVILRSMFAIVLEILMVVINVIHDTI